MTEITIHGFAPSTYTRSARMAAIELGIDHKLVPIVYGSPEHFALHPFGKMPIMTHGESVVFETLAIMTWLDELSPKSGLFGFGRQERANIQQLISVALDYAYQPVVHVRLENGAPDPDQLKAAALVLDWLNIRLEDNIFLAGSSMSAADLFLAPMIAYHARQVGEDRTYLSRAHLEEWMKMMTERKSFQETAQS